MYILYFFLPYKILFGPKIFMTTLSTSAILGKVKKANVKAKVEVTDTRAVFDSFRLAAKFETELGFTKFDETECPINIMAMIAAPPKELVAAMITP